MGAAPAASVSGASVPGASLSGAALAAAALAAAALAVIAVTLLGGWSVWLARVDLRTHRLPNPVLGWASLTVGVPSVAALLVSGQSSRLLAALAVTGCGLGAAVLGWLARPAALGAGDLKLVPLTVFPVAALDPALLATAYLGALVLGLLLAAAVARRRGRASFAAGPILLLACWTALAFGWTALAFGWGAHGGEVSG
ncbi:hypothetical protein [Leucobacter chromiireducens]|nr:hypothetical protein [Leucobacter chromiireducens]